GLCGRPGVTAGGTGDSIWRLRALAAGVAEGGGVGRAVGILEEAVGGCAGAGVAGGLSASGAGLRAGGAGESGDQGGVEAGVGAADTADGAGSLRASGFAVRAIGGRAGTGADVGADAVVSGVAGVTECAAGAVAVAGIGTEQMGKQ